jgi:hypothetical protein
MNLDSIIKKKCYIILVKVCSEVVEKSGKDILKREMVIRIANYARIKQNWDELSLTRNNLFIRGIDAYMYLFLLEKANLSRIGQNTREVKNK